LYFKLEFLCLVANAAPHQQLDLTQAQGSAAAAAVMGGSACLSPAGNVFYERPALSYSLDLQSTAGGCVQPMVADILFLARVQPHHELA
jgi:hypothetical protein